MRLAVIIAHSRVPLNVLPQIISKRDDDDDDDALLWDCRDGGLWG